MYLTTPALKDTINDKNNHVEFCSSNMGSKIFLSMCPMILLFGTFTNILSLLVLSRKRMRKHSTYVYLAILSVIDLLALWLGITRDFLAHGFNIHIRDVWLCKLHSFLFYYSLDMSSWILVAVSCDRFVAITFVFSSYTKQQLLKLLAKPKLICSVLLALFALLNFHFVIFVNVLDATEPQQHHHNHSEPTSWTYSELFSHKMNFRAHNTHDKHTIGVADEYYFCVIDERKHASYFYFFSSIWPYIDLSAYAIVPFCIMLVCNIAIIKNAKFSTPSMETTNTQLTTTILPGILNRHHHNHHHPPTTTVVIPPTPTSGEPLGGVGKGNNPLNFPNGKLSGEPQAPGGNSSSKKSHRTLSRQKRLDIETPSTTPPIIPTNLNNGSIKKKSLNYLQPPQPMPLTLQPPLSLSSLENTNKIMSDSDDFFLMNKLTNNFLADKNKLTSSAASSFDLSLNEEEEFKKNCNSKNDNEFTGGEDVAPQSKFNILFKKLWFLGKNRNSSSSKCMLKTNVSSQFSNKSFVLETKRKRPPLISIDDESRRRVFVDGVGSGAGIAGNSHMHNSSLNNDRFFSSQINIYQTHAPMQRTISQRFHSTRPMVNLHSRNIRMMSLTIMLVSCIFILLTLPIMLFIVIDKINFERPSLIERTNCKSVVWAFVNLFMYVNHSINFVLYCLTGSKFRTELATLFISPQKIVNATMPELNFNFFGGGGGGGGSRRSSNANGHGHGQQVMSNSAANLTTCPNFEINYGNRLRTRNVFIKTQSSDL